MIVDWLNIPTAPDQLKLATHASTVTENSVSWTFDDYICGLTHVPDSGSGAGYTKTQKEWLVQVATDLNGDSIIDSKTHNTRPTRHELTLVDSVPDWDAYVDNHSDLIEHWIDYVLPTGLSKHDWGKSHYENYGVKEGRILTGTGTKTGTQYYCRLVAVGEGDIKTASGDWISNHRTNKPPVLVMLGEPCYEFSLGNGAETKSVRAKQYVFIRGSFTWEQAKADAESRGGRLACITSECLQAQLEREYVSQVGTFRDTTDTNYRFWLGATSPSPSDVSTFTWVNGVDVTSTYTNWHPGEPNGGGSGTNAVTIGRYSTGKWNDADGLLGYVLELVELIEWEDPLAYAYDADDGILPVEVTGEVDYTTPGTYTLTYTTQDSDGLTAQSTRTVTISNEGPVLRLLGDQTITV
jgi:hypothetical protein